jgi:2-methylcitrate dehydratase PrpD
MTVIADLATRLSGVKAQSLPATVVEKARIHLLDSLGAWMVGVEMAEGRAMARLAGATMDSPLTVGNRPGLLEAVMAAVAAARCTEVDDIHIASCTTPGSVIVPTAMVLACHGHFQDGGDFLSAIVQGYEVMIRLGLAADGPNILYQGVWPTYLAAPLGTAAVAARAFGLDAEQTTHALANALGMTVGTAVRGRGPASSRWLMAGVGAKNGVLAALSAREGFQGDTSLLEGRANGPLGLELRVEHLLAELGERFEFEETSIKPYPTARQGYAAIEAFRELISHHQLEPGALGAITVEVPAPVMAVMNQPRLPESRLESVVSAQYQIALAALEPERLYNVRRENLPVGKAISELMARITIIPSEALAAYYPSSWPARVTLEGEAGTFSQEMLHPLGDAKNPFDWTQACDKFKRYATPLLGEAAVENALPLLQGLEGANKLPALVALLAPVFQGVKAG